MSARAAASPPAFTVPEFAAGATVAFALFAMSIPAISLGAFSIASLWSQPDADGLRTLLGLLPFAIPIGTIVSLLYGLPILFGAAILLGIPVQLAIGLALRESHRIRVHAAAHAAGGALTALATIGIILAVTASEFDRGGAGAIVALPSFWILATCSAAFACTIGRMVGAGMAASRGGNGRIRDGRSAIAA